MNRHIPSFVVMASFLAVSSLPAIGRGQAAEQSDLRFYPVAVLPFQERGEDVENLGEKISDLLFANLVTNPRLYLVDRADLGKILSEQELNQSGLVKPGEATELGKLTGARIIVTGSVLQVGEKLYVVAKIIGTESTRVLGASVKGHLGDDLDQLAERLAAGIADTVTRRAGELIPRPVPHIDRVAALKDALGQARRPVVAIDIQERHVGSIPAMRVDPAAQTEITLLCMQTGFQTIDPAAGDESEADVRLIGEGLSEFATRHGDLVSVRARLEVKAIDRETGRVLAVDRETVVSAGLAERIVARDALQEAAARIAGRLLPKIAAR